MFGTHNLCILPVNRANSTNSVQISTDIIYIVKTFLKEIHTYFQEYQCPLKKTTSYKNAGKYNTI